MTTQGPKKKELINKTSFDFLELAYKNLDTYKVRKTTKQELLKLFRELLQDDALNEWSCYRSHERWSSLTALLIVSEVENRTGVLISIDMLRSCADLGALCAHVLSAYEAANREL